MKKVLNSLYLILFIFFKIASSFIILFECKAPHWFIIFDLFISVLIVFLISFYILGYRPKRYWWLWKSVPYLLTILAIWNSLYLIPTFRDTSLVLISYWLILLPAVYLSFRFTSLYLRSDQEKVSEEKMNISFAVKWIFGMIFMMIFSLWGILTISGYLLRPPRPRLENRALSELRIIHTWQDVYHAENNTYSDNIKEFMYPDDLFDRGIVMKMLFADEKHYKMQAMFIKYGVKFFYVIQGPDRDIKEVSKTEIEGFKNSVKSLMIAFKDKDPMIRSHAALALGAKKNIGKYRSRVNDALIQALMEDKEAYVRFSAVGALALVNDKHVIDALFHALNDKDEEVRSAASLAIAELKGEYGEYVFKSLITSLNSSDPDNQKSAASILGYRRDNHMEDPFIRIIKNEDNGIRISAHFYVKDEQTLIPLINSLKDDEKDIREAVIYIQGRCVTIPLRDALNDKNNDVRIYGVMAFYNIKDEQAVKALNNVLDHYDEN